MDLKYNIWKDCRRVPLPELLDFIVDNRGKTVPTVNQNEACNVVLIATNCIRNENLYPVYEKIRFISEDTYKTWFRSHPIPGDIIFVNKGTPGRVCLCPDIIDFCIAQDMMAFRVDSNKLYNEYLLAVLRSRVMQEQIRITSVGDTIPHFKKEFLKDLYIPVPPMEIQRIIGDYYYNLSQKIELNKKINENLEQQAQAIFKSWFVDFEPFGGVTPDDWKSASLLDIADYLNGLAMQKYRPVDDEVGLPVLKIKELRQGFCDSNSELCSPNIKADYIIQNGDVIFSWSGSLLVDFWCGGKCGLNQHLFKVTSKGFDKWFYYIWTKNHLNRFIAIAADMATTMGHIKRSELEKSLVLIPNETDYAKIGNLLKPIYEEIIKNRIENQRLANLRDTLLPKLMNGEIDVSQVKI